MATVFGIHEIELGAGADTAAFERLGAAAVAAGAPDGIKFRLLKGDRGARSGHYVLLIELDSVQVRDRFFPTENEDSEELHRFVEQHPAVGEHWSRFMAFDTTEVTTDYVVIAE
jgi:hypothetical protein